MPRFSIAKFFHSKIYPNWDFWFENKPSGNPGLWRQIRLRDAILAELEISK
jgi:hypothetical protein